MEITCKTIWKLFTLSKLGVILWSNSSCNWSLSKFWKCHSLWNEWMHTVQRRLYFHMGFSPNIKIQMIFFTFIFYSSNELRAQIYHEIIMPFHWTWMPTFFHLKVNKCRFYCYHWARMRLVFIHQIHLNASCMAWHINDTIIIK